MSMTSTLEALPVELLDQILEYFAADPAQAACLAHLLQCSQRLRRHVEPILYRHPRLHDGAMRWGCKTGNATTIRRAVSYGASASVVYDLIHGWSSLSLSLAAKYRRTEAFQCLLELGASIDRFALPLADQLKRRVERTRHLVHHVCACAKPLGQPQEDIVRLFFQSGLHSQIQKAGQGPDIYHPLVRLVASGASVELIRDVLDCGFELDQVQSYKRMRALSPLSAAIIANSPDVFRLLLARGANLHGKELTKPTFGALHIPIFAAAYMMATSEHGIELMRLCLENGADINQKSRVVGLPFGLAKSNKWRRSSSHHHYASPIYVFLDGIISWADVAVPNPVEGLSYLIEHDAVIDNPNEEWRVLDPPTPRELYSKIVSTLELLLTKWGPELLARPRGRDVATTLIQHGAAARDAAYLLTKFAYDHYHVSEARAQAKLEGQRALAWPIIQDLDKDKVSRVLQVYMMKIIAGGQRLGEINVDVVDWLIEAGADINDPYGSYPNTGKTMLYRLCEIVKSPTLVDFNDMMADLCRPGTYHVVEPDNIMRFLLSRGADPDIAYNGKKAYEVLVGPLDNPPPRHEEQMRGYAAVFNDADEKKVKISRIKDRFPPKN